MALSKIVLRKFSARLTRRRRAGCVGEPRIRSLRKETQKTALDLLSKGKPLKDEGCVELQQGRQRIARAGEQI
jgi:hypothetical protein